MTFEGHFDNIFTVDTLCAQLTRNLLARAKFLVLSEKKTATYEYADIDNAVNVAASDTCGLDEADDVSWAYFIFLLCPLGPRSQRPGHVSNDSKQRAPRLYCHGSVQSRHSEPPRRPLTSRTTDQAISLDKCKKQQFIHKLTASDTSKTAKITKR